MCKHKFCDTPFLRAQPLHEHWIAFNIRRCRLFQFIEPPHRVTPFRPAHFAWQLQPAAKRWPLRLPESQAKVVNIELDEAHTRRFASGGTLPKG
jgi:hypothetical protein